MSIPSNQEPQPGNFPGAAASSELQNAQTQIKKSRSPEPVKLDLGDLVENKTIALTTEARAQREYLGTQPLLRVFIPRTKEEPKTAMHQFCINGFHFAVPKGRYVNVPETVAQNISEAYEQSESIMADHPLNLDNNKAADREFNR